MGTTIGIDPSVSRPAIALWPSAETWQLSVKGEGAERLLSLYGTIHDWAALSCPDDLEAVFIERPVGKFPKRSLDHACGVIQVAILNGLDEQFPHRPSIFELSPSEWKKAIGIGGNAGKPRVAEWAEYHAFPKVVEKPLTQDEADALAIAAAGHSMLSEGAVR